MIHATLFFLFNQNQLALDDSQRIAELVGDQRPEADVPVQHILLVFQGFSQLGGTFRHGFFELDFRMPQRFHQRLPGGQGFSLRRLARVAFQPDALDQRKRQQIPSGRLN